MKKEVNILVVDDEEIMRSLFTDVLEAEGYIVITVCSGAEAVDKAKEKPFDLVFIDIHMPGMNGLQTLQALRQIIPETPMVMMDSIPDLLLAKSLDEGAIRCIHKPFHIKEVKDIVNEFVGK